MFFSRVNYLKKMTDNDKFENKNEEYQEYLIEHEIKNDNEEQDKDYDSDESGINFLIQYCNTPLEEIPKVDSEEDDDDEDYELPEPDPVPEEFEISDEFYTEDPNDYTYAEKMRFYNLSCEFMLGCGMSRDLLVDPPVPMPWEIEELNNPDDSVQIIEYEKHIETIEISDDEK